MSSSTRSLVLYRLAPDAEWTIHKCSGSGRFQFDLTEAKNKARWLVVNRLAHEAKVVRVGDEDPIAAWEWNEAASTYRQTIGEEHL